MCGGKILWKFDEEMTSNRVCNLFQGTRHKYISDTLHKHCKEKKHAIFHFLARPVFDAKGKTTTYLHVQNCMSKGLLHFYDNIPLYYFKLMANGQSLLFIVEIANIMGAAIACNKQDHLARHKMRKAFDKNVTSTQWNNFVNFCDKQLRLIGKRLTTFDYKCFMDNGVTPEMLWNATNLFLKQGMYFDQTFPPILGLELKNLVLDSYFDQYETSFEI